MNATWKAIAGVLVIFILGWLAGSISTLVLARHKTLAIMRGGPHAVAAVLERRLTHNLALTSDQQEKVHAIFDQNVEARLEIQHGVQPQVQALNRNTMEQLATTLRPEQMEKLKANLATLRERTGRPIFGSAASEPSPTNAGTGGKPAR